MDNSYIFVEISLFLHFVAAFSSRVILCSFLANRVLLASLFAAMMVSGGIIDALGR